MWHRDAAYYRARPWRGQHARSGGGVLINQAIHTLDLLEWLVGEVTAIGGQVGRYALDGVIDVEDTATAVLTHAGGARSVLFATVANATDAPVTIEIVTSKAVLLIRGDLTVTYPDGRTEVVAEPVPSTGGRSYWGCLARPAHRRLLPHAGRSGAVLDLPGRGRPRPAADRPPLPPRRDRLRCGFSPDSWTRSRPTSPSSAGSRPVSG